MKSVAEVEDHEGAKDSVYVSDHDDGVLYYRTFTPEDLAAYQAAFGDLVMDIDGVERRAAGWPAWAITTRIDTGRRCGMLSLVIVRSCPVIRR